MLMSLDKLGTDFNQKIDDLKQIWKETEKEYASATESIGDQVTKLKSENAELKQKYDEAQAKLDKIEGQLANTIEQMQSMSKATDKGIDAMKLLDVYIVLMEKVYESQIHSRILIMLHGAKDKYKMTDLATAGGISGIEVRKAVFELRNAGLVNFNEDTEEIELITRFLE